MKSRWKFKKTAAAVAGMVASLVLAASALGSDPDAKTLRLIGPDITPKIVLSAQASEVERFAAKELSEYLEKITGVQCPVISGTAPAATAQSPLIILGNHVQNNDLQPRKLGSDDSIISVEADRLRIVGGSLPPVKLPDGRVSVQERGTLYGVYHLLNQLGVRWFRPEPWGEHVPKLQVIELSLGRQDFKPAFKYRDSTHLYSWYTTQTPEQADMATLWSVRNFLNVNSSAGKYGGSYGISIAHNYNRLLPPQKYFKDHPEYFALVNGKRMEKGQPCLGNPQVQRIMADAAVEAARRNPSAVTVSVSPNDGGNWCECNLCRALDDPELTSPNGGEKRLGNASMTNRVAYVNNLIARRVGAAVPGMKVAWYAYLATTEVPTKVKKLEPNIYVAPTSMAAAYGNYSKLLEDPRVSGNRNFLNIMRGWSKLTPLLTREYWSGGVFPGPIPMLTVLQDRLKNYRQYKVDGIINESHPNWGSQGILHYFLARLLWDPEIDMEKELEEYCRDYYGPAAGPMLKYHQLLEKSSLDGPDWYFLGRFLTRLYENTTLVEQMGKLMDEALPLAKGHEPYEKRLYGEWAGYKVALAVNQTKTLLKQGNKADAKLVWTQLKRFLDENSANGDVFNKGSVDYAWNTMGSELGVPKGGTSRIQVRLDEVCGPVKPLHGVNLGPMASYGTRDFSESYKRWRIPSVRIHDATHSMMEVVDLHTIFPNPHADPDDPANYVFAWTDDYLAAIRNAGAEIYFRLGESIEHQSRKRYIIGDRWPSPEALARVCVNIARHYNEGWANGFKWGIRYWEFWNEPNLGVCWVGTPDQFLDFYRAVSVAFRQYDPSLKIGLAGFASASIMFPKAVQGDLPPQPYRTMILKAIEEKLPIDFVSWHCYSPGWEKMAWYIGNVREFLDENGLKHTENHLTEWNWAPEFPEGGNIFTAWATHDYEKSTRGYEMMAGVQAAAYIFGSLARFQYLPLDMAHFYAGADSPFGLFERAGGRPRKNQVAFDVFSGLLGGELLGVESDDYENNTVLPVRLGDKIELCIAHLNPQVKQVTIELKPAGQIAPTARQYTDAGWNPVQPTVSEGNLTVPLAGAGITVVEWKAEK